MWTRQVLHTINSTPSPKIAMLQISQSQTNNQNKIRVNGLLPLSLELMNFHNLIFRVSEAKILHIPAEAKTNKI